MVKNIRRDIGGFVTKEFLISGFPIADIPPAEFIAIKILKCTASTTALRNGHV